MARGPLPTGTARRRNEPTIPTTNLPAGGHRGRAPKIPAAYNLGPAGKAWWKWAWRLPQAAAWDVGALYHVARRAQLEDELAAIDAVDGGLDLGDLMTVELPADALEAFEEIEQRVRWIIRSLKRMAAGSTTVMKEMRELDNRLGLNPKALAELRWTIVADGQQPATAATSTSSNVRRLRAVDPTAAAG